MRRANQGVWVGLCVGLAACTCGSPPAPAGPNVLVLTIDTLRADHLGLYGMALPTTPALDALLSKGTVFERAIAPIPRTTPALVSMWTGRYPQGTGVRRLTDAVRPEVPLLTERAKAEGYATAAVVSNHILVPKRRLDRGFDHYDHAGDSRDAAQTTVDALAALDALPSDRAAWLWVHYIDPHVPYDPPEAYVDSFDPGYEGRYARRFGQAKGGVGAKAYPVDLPKREAVFHNPLPDEVNAHIRTLYAADVRQSDDAVATLLQGLQARRGEDWVVVFTSDHAESLGEHDFFYDHGDYVYLPSLHVPLAVVDLRTPLAQPRRVSAWTSLVDVAPTLAGLLGWDWSGDGRDLLTVAPAKEVPPPRTVFAESGRSFFEAHVRRRTDFTVAGRFRTAVREGLQLIWTPGRPADSAYELYDLTTDPGATHNVWADRHTTPDVVALQDALMAHVAADPAVGTPPPTLDVDDLEALKALGYVDER